jgi:membrane protease subunit (stomatin/prohibitin family)
LKKSINESFLPLGLRLTAFQLQNVNLPEGVEKALEKNAASRAIDDMQRFTQYQVAESIPTAAANPGGGFASAGMGLSMGVAMGQQMSQAMGAAMAPQAGTAAAPAPAANDPMALLEKLKGLLDKGLISQADYESKKTEILSRL